MTLNHARLPIPPLRPEQRHRIPAKRLKSRGPDGAGEREGISTNRKACHDYEILETYEAGLVLRGTEVKSLREGQVNFKDCYASIDRGEAWLVGCHIAPYHHGTDANHDPERRRGSSCSIAGRSSGCSARWPSAG